MVLNSLKTWKKIQKKIFFYAKTGIKPEKLDPKSHNKNSPKVFDARYRTQKRYGHGS